MKANYIEDDIKAIQKYKFINHFIPHKHHKKRARLLSNKALFMYCSVLLFFLGLFRFIPVAFPGVLGYASSIDVSELLRDTNEKRANIGLKPLTLNSKLSNAANKKAQDMFHAGYWAHVSPKGTRPWDFILAQGYDYVYAGENLAKTFRTQKM